MIILNNFAKNKKISTYVHAQCLPKDANDLLETYTTSLYVPYSIIFSLHLKFTKRRKEQIFPEVENSGKTGIDQSGRREMIKNLASIPVLGLAFFGFAKKYGWFSHEEEQVG